MAVVVGRQVGRWIRAMNVVVVVLVTEIETTHKIVLVKRRNSLTLATVSKQWTCKDSKISQRVVR